MPVLCVVSLCSVFTGLFDEQVTTVTTDVVISHSGKRPAFILCITISVWIMLKSIGAFLRNYAVCVYWDMPYSASFSLCKLRPMTHALETSTTNRIYFSSVDFGYMCRANLGPDSSGTRFRLRLEHCSIPSQKVACTWLKWWLAIGRW